MDSNTFTRYPKIEIYHNYNYLFILIFLDYFLEIRLTEYP